MTNVSLAELLQIIGDKEVEIITLKYEIRSLKEEINALRAANVPADNPSDPNS